MIIERKDDSQNEKGIELKQMYQAIGQLGIGELGNWGIGRIRRGAARRRHYGPFRP